MDWAVPGFPCSPIQRHLEQLHPGELVDLRHMAMAMSETIGGGAQYSIGY